MLSRNDTFYNSSSARFRQFCEITFDFEPILLIQIIQINKIHVYVHINN